MSASRCIVLAFLLLLIQACGHSRHVEVTDLRQAPLTAKTYTVEKGDTLYAIAWRFDLEYKKMAQANNISAPYRLGIGQIVHLTETAPKTKRYKSGGSSHKSVTRASQSSAVSRKNQPSTTYASKSSSQSQVKSVQKRPEKKFISGNDKGWLWPLSGKVTRRFSNQNQLSKGIDIAARLGVPVYSSRSGKVVYAGNGLKGYGNLIIVKHDETYLSAYAHNRAILIEEGSLVKQGQKIAEVGNSGTQTPKLHFEIRKRGKPINPLSLLPK